MFIVKKQGLFVIFAVFATLLFATCNSESNVSQLEEVLQLEELLPALPLQIAPELEGLVHMVVTDVTPTHVTVTIQNNSDWLIHGSSCTLEAYYNGQWLQVPMMECAELPIFFPLIMDSILPHDSTSFTKNLTRFPYLGAERYRIRKDVGISAWQPYELPDGTMILMPPPPPDRPVVTPPPPPPNEIVDETISDAQTETAIYFHPELIDGIPRRPSPPPPRPPFHEIVAEFDWNPETNAPTLEELSLAPPLRILPGLEDLVYMVTTNVTSTHVTVAIQNNTDLQRFTWRDYTLEAYYNGQWLHVPMVESHHFTTELIPLPAHDSTSFIKDLSSFPSLGAELYRIRKRVARHEVVAEFDWPRRRVNFTPRW